MISICFSLAPWRSSVSTSPRTSESTMKSLKREATMAKRRSRATRSPLMVRMLSMPGCPSARFVDVFGHFEPEGREAVHLLRRAQHAHPGDAEVAQDLGADAVGAQHLRAARLAGRDGAVARTHRLGDLERALVRPQQHHHAFALARDALHGAAQRPAVVSV